MRNKLVLNRCHHCGENPNIDLADAIYPVYRDKTEWWAGCTNPKCGAAEAGRTRNEAIEKWNALENRESNITAKKVIELANKTGSGRIACRIALTKAKGDIKKATELLAKSKL